MLRIEDGAIYLTKGDTAYLKVNLAFDDGTEYEVQEGDTLTLSVKPDTKDETPYVFTKTVKPGETFEIKPEDTKEQEVGSYYYDVQLNTSIGEIFTVIEPTRFYIRNEVTVNA